MTITIEHLFTIDGGLGAPVEVGEVPGGFRRVIPITGGRVHAPALEGEVLPGGADWNLMRPDGTIQILARYEIRTTDGAIVSVINEGLQQIDREAAARSGKPPVMLTRPTFETGSNGPTWLNAGAFVGELELLEPIPPRVQVRVHRMTPA